MGAYVKKTDRRAYEERSFSVRAVHREPPDLHKLSELLIRLTLQETGRTRAERRAAEAPETYRPAVPEAVVMAVSEGTG
jgi:hypothetical protein